MKKNYQFPEITVVTLAREDVIATSAMNEVMEAVYIKDKDKVSFNIFQ